MKMSFGKFIVISCFGFMEIMAQSCTSAHPKSDNFPEQSAYPGYNLLDARYTQTLKVDAKLGEKIAIVVRDLSTTAYSNILTPRYQDTMVQFNGVEQCCLPTPALMGASGLMVYKFEFIGTGKTKIQLIARHKGLSTSAERFESDVLTTLSANVE